MYSTHADNNSENTSNNNETRQDNPTEVATSPAKTMATTSTNDNAATVEQSEPYSARTALERRSRDYQFGDSPYRHRRHRRQRFKRRHAIYFVVGIVVFIIGLTYIANELSTDPNAAAFADASYPNTVDENEVDSLSELFHDTEEGEVEPAPSWIQGKWIAHTELYDIEISISGDTITETEGGNSVSGSFVCKNQKLICSYGENNIFIYRLDANAHTIDCGDGIIMHKAR